jgi:hypothetical protein
MSKSQEEQYQLERAYDKYSDIPKSTVKKLFNRAWLMSMALGSILNILDAMVDVYRHTKNGQLK